MNSSPPIGFVLAVVAMLIAVVVILVKIFTLEGKRRADKKEAFQNQPDSEAPFPMTPPPGLEAQTPPSIPDMGTGPHHSTPISHEAGHMGGGFDAGGHSGGGHH